MKQGIGVKAIFYMTKEKLGDSNKTEGTWSSWKVSKTSKLQKVLNQHYIFSLSKSLIFEKISELNRTMFSFLQV